MKLLNFSILFVSFFIFSCSKKTESSSTVSNVIRWQVYKVLYGLTENTKTSNSRYTNYFSTISCHEDTTTINETCLLYIPNYLLVDLDFYCIGNKNDTIKYLIEIKYQNNCVSPQQAVSVPDYLAVFKEKIVDVRVGSMSLAKHYYSISDKLFGLYLQNNRTSINKWLLIEAQRRGVLK